MDTSGLTRELITKVQVTPAVAPCKVAIIHEVDRMNTAAANVFLKTLEEPPANTTLLLLTTRPYALLPTIRSRVLHFRFPSAAAPVAAPVPEDLPAVPADRVKCIPPWVAKQVTTGSVTETRCSPP